MIVLDLLCLRLRSFVLARVWRLHLDALHEISQTPGRRRRLQALARRDERAHNVRYDAKRRGCSLVGKRISHAGMWTENPPCGVFPRCGRLLSTESRVLLPPPARRKRLILSRASQPHVGFITCRMRDMSASMFSYVHAVLHADTALAIPLCVLSAIYFVQFDR